MDIPVLKQKIIESFHAGLGVFSFAWMQKIMLIQKTYSI